MINQQNIAAIQVLNQGIIKKCGQCVCAGYPSLFEDKEKLASISQCEKVGCGLYSVRFQR